MAKPPREHLICVSASVKDQTLPTLNSWLSTLLKDFLVDECMGVNGRINTKLEEQGDWIQTLISILMPLSCYPGGKSGSSLEILIYRHSSVCWNFIIPLRNGTVILFHEAAGPMCSRGTTQNGREPLKLLGWKLQTLARLSSNTKFLNFFHQNNVTINNCVNSHSKKK